MIRDPKAKQVGREVIGFQPKKRHPESIWASETPFRLDSRSRCSRRAPSGISFPEVKRDSTASRVRVCLLWKHPLVLAEVQRALPEASFELLPVRIESPVPGPLKGPIPPETLLYVIDGNSVSEQAESLVADVLALNPSARVVVIGEEFSEATAFPLLRLGTKGIVTYTEVRERLPRVLGEVNTGGFWVPRALLSRFVDATRAASLPRRPAAGSPTLTPREREVLEDLLQNLSNKEIARKRRISSRTAKFHVSNVLAKHGVRRRADLFLLSFPERGASQPT